MTFQLLKRLSRPFTTGIPHKTIKVKVRVFTTDKRYPHYPLPDFNTFKKNAPTSTDIVPEHRPPMDDTRKMQRDPTLEEALREIRRPGRSGVLVKSKTGTT